MLSCKEIEMLEHIFEMGKNGFLFAPVVPDQFCIALSLCLEGYLEAEPEYSMFGASCRGFRFTLTSVGKEIVRIHQNCSGG